MHLFTIVQQSLSIQTGLNMKLGPTTATRILPVVSEKKFQDNVSYPSHKYSIQSTVYILNRLYSSHLSQNSNLENILDRVLTIMTKKRGLDFFYGVH